MTDADLKLLQDAAKAAGIPLKPDFAERFEHYMADPLMWNPLEKDGDALRLAVKLGITIGRAVTHEAWAAQLNSLDETIYESGDPFVATRRAIVRAAAAMVAKPAPKLQGVFDNRLTMCREWWHDGFITDMITAHAIAQKDTIRYNPKFGSQKRWGSYPDVPGESPPARA